MTPTTDIPLLQAVDPKDEKYKKARRKMAKFQTMAAMAAMITDDETDDLLAEIFNVIVTKHFDEVYEIVTRKRNR